MLWRGEYGEDGCTSFRDVVRSGSRRARTGGTSFRCVSQASFARGRVGRDTQGCRPNSRGAAAAEGGLKNANRNARAGRRPAAVL
jgi:hypothetical protein